MKTPSLGLVGVALLVSCGAPQGAAYRGDLRGWGTLRAALRDGEDQARVAVAEVARPDTYALGALEGLAGEVTVLDGEVWVTRGDAEHPVTRHGPSSDERATVLFAFEVQRWRELLVAEDVDPSELDSYVAARAREAGLDLTRPFPFRIEGGLVHLDMHVVAGECPIRARQLGTEASAGAYQLHAAATPGRLLGIFADHSAGVVCHMGSRTHVHAVLDTDGGLTGHVETVGLARGAVLLLPLD